MGWCVFTHSIRGAERARESTGRMASSFFLIQKPAAMPGSEPFSAFFAADIRAPFFSADVLKKCALVGMHVMAAEGRVESKTCGDMVAQRVQFGKVRMKLGLTTKASHRVSLAKTMCATARCTSSGCMGLVTRSVSLLGGLGACEGGIKLSHCTGYVVPGNA